MSVQNFFLNTFFNQSLQDSDPEVNGSLIKELERQKTHLELIASENIVSKAVLDAQGSVLTNKYAEGYPGKRYYGGCEFVDVAENLALERVKELYNVKFANVQPHSGAQANGAVFLALLNPGDTILGMGIDQGGHLTHGATTTDVASTVAASSVCAASAVGSEAAQPDITSREAARAPRAPAPLNFAHRATNVKERHDGSRQAWNTAEQGRQPSTRFIDW